MYVILFFISEFHANGSWECIPVHPRLSLHKSKPKYCNVNEVDLRNTSKLCFLMCTYRIKGYIRRRNFRRTPDKLIFEGFIFVLLH